MVLETDDCCKAHYACKDQSSSAQGLQRCACMHADGVAAVMYT